MKDIVRVAACVPQLKIGNVEFNLQETIKFIKEAHKKGVSILTFPELSLTGYTCGDLFFSQALLERTLAALCNLKKQIPENMIVAVGAPVQIQGQLYNCAFVLVRGKIVGAVPKTFLPNYSEYYERRWFSSAAELTQHTIEIDAEQVPVSSSLLFRAGKGITLGIELCEDLWSPLPPSTLLALNGANVILNLSASNETILKRSYRRNLVSQQSARTYSAYIYASAGTGESTSDLIYSGHSIIAENGSIVAENTKYIDNNYLLSADIDMGRVAFDRMHNKTFQESARLYGNLLNPVYVDIPDFSVPESDGSLLQVSRLPFVPETKTQRVERCMQIFDMQANALARRLSITGGKLTVGVSGGLDSTLALLVAIRSMELLSLPRTNIIAITMPCFGTSDETLTNALELMEKLGVTSRTIPIKESVLQHFADIGHSSTDYSVTYENAQARERTQVLMDVANKEGAIVLGTGDLSELALGWCTYNADHMSMYGVNSGVPKTLVRWIISGVAENNLIPEATQVLDRIIDTPISPELLPPDAKGNISQKTEDIVGPYALHDFFLYYMVRYQYAPSKIFDLANLAFAGLFDKVTIKKWLIVFYRRFFSQQFKRNCLPDGVKVGSICLSPRGDWRMPSDADSTQWIQEAEALKTED